MVESNDPQADYLRKLAEADAGTEPPVGRIRARARREMTSRDLMTFSFSMLVSTVLTFISRVGAAFSQRSDEVAQDEQDEQEQDEQDKQKVSTDDESDSKHEK